MDELEQRVDVIAQQQTEIQKSLDFLAKAYKQAEEDKKKEEDEAKLFKRFVKFLKDAGFQTKSETVETLKGEGFITKEDVASLAPKPTPTPSREENTPQEVVEGSAKTTKKQNEEDYEEEDEFGGEMKKEDEEEDGEKEELKKQNAALQKALSQLKESIPGLVQEGVSTQLSKMGWHTVTNPVVKTPSPEETVIVKGKASEGDIIERLTKLPYSDLATLKFKVESGQIQMP